MDRRTDRHGQNYIPPPSADDNNNYYLSVEDTLEYTYHTVIRIHLPHSAPDKKG